MGNTLKSFFKYLIPLGVAGLLLWYQYKDTSTADLFAVFKETNYFWIILSIIPALISHLSRARRWILLMEPLNYKPGLYSTFLAVMSGYFANLILPRMGEVTRCGVLQNTDKIPLNVTLGTVLAERAFDVFMLLIIVGFAFVVEFETLNNFLGPLIHEKLETLKYGVSGAFYILAFIIIAFLAIVALIFYYREKIMAIPLIAKIKSFVSGLLAGVISVKKMEKKWEFLFHSVLIWVCYYLMSYLVFFSMPATYNLGPLIALAIFAIGSMAMVAPVQGGVGAFHFMVGAGFMLYGLAKEEADAAAFLMHTSQTIFIIILGGICFLLSFAFKRKEKNKLVTHDSRKNS